MSGKTLSMPRTAAIIGPFASGKTTLLDALLLRSGAITRQGRVRDGNTVGDSSPESRSRQISTETNVVSTEYLGERWTLLDCPGSVEFQQDTLNCLSIVDTAIVVCEPDPHRAIMVAPILKFLDRNSIPHLLFINKIDGNDVRLRETLEALQAVSDRPLVLREVPIREDGVVTGFVDLVSERAYRYRAGQTSDLIQIPADLLAEEEHARRAMMEQLADHDDHLLEELLDDISPPKDELFADLTKDLADDLIVPVFFGSAEQDQGITRLWKALRHDCPGPDVTAARLGGEGIFVFKTLHAAHTGKLSFVRLLNDTIADGQTLSDQRVSGLYLPVAAGLSKVPNASLGDVVALGRMDGVATGDVLEGSGVLQSTILPPLFSVAVSADKKGDEVKLSGALGKLMEEDPSLSLCHTPDHNELVLWGQGEIHIQVALDRLKSRFGLSLQAHKPTIPYQETIKVSALAHGRHKKQSGGHGQFGDVHIEIRPQPRGDGFVFEDKIVGGAIPRNYIPAVEDGILESVQRGPLGFPVVDIAVTLLDGSYHAVDSSDMAFKAAARLAMADGLARCEPVLLEPILKVEVSIPNDCTAKAQRIVSGRRGQILGYDGKDEWPGWDVVTAYLPQSEMGDLIIELRSLTMGVGTFVWQFDHLQELGGKAAEKIIEASRLKNS